MNRILVVQTAFLGDVVLTTPLLRELRRAAPGAPVDVLTTASGAELLHGLDLGRVLVYDKRRTDRGIAGFVRVARRLRGAGYRIVVAAHRSARTGLLVRLTGAPLRIGFAGSASSRACNETVEWRGDRHAAHRYLELARPAGGDPDTADAVPRVAVGTGAAESAARMLEGVGVSRGEPYVAIAPGSIWGAKRWTARGFAGIAHAIERAGRVPLLVGSPMDSSRCREVALEAGGRTVDASGRTSIAELVAVLRDAKALVGNDSGPAHIAAAVGTPTVTVFGPTVPEMGYAPFGSRNRNVGLAGLACRPCHRHGPPTCPLGHHRCMVDLAESTVLDALERLLQTDSGRDERAG